MAIRKRKNAKKRRRSRKKNPTYPTATTKYIAAALGGYLAWKFID